MDQFLTPEDLAKRLVVSRSTVYNRIKSGDWPVTKLGPRTYRFSPAQVTAITTQEARPVRRTNTKRLREALAKIA